MKDIYPGNLGIFLVPISDIIAISISCSVSIHSRDIFLLEIPGTFIATIFKDLSLISLALLLRHEFLLITCFLFLNCLCFPLGKHLASTGLSYALYLDLLLLK